VPDFRYETRNAAGKVSSGVLSAANLSAAGDLLRKRGEFIITLLPAGDPTKKPWYQKSLGFGPSSKDVLAFTSQLAVMLRAGINLRSALDGIADQAQNARFKDMIRIIQRDVESGRQFSEALARYPKTFGPLYINMVRASEMSGGLSRMLDRIAGYLTQQIETQRMVVGAMVYPGIIGTLAVGVTIFLLTWVLPKFMVIFQGKEQHLPKPTKMLLALSDIMVNYWYLLVPGVFGVAVGIFVFYKTAVGRTFFDTLKLRVPLLKKMFRALYITRSLHTMGQLINAGVPMLDTLVITAEVSGNTHYRRMWHNVYSSVKQGKKISGPLMSGSLLPKSVSQMISAGEESGKLGEVLDEVSEFYKRELTATIKSCTSMIEPLMIVVMGGIVGFVAMSMMLPIFKMSQLVK
jgi:type IV pilus assembly protein PilC